MAKRVLILATDGFEQSELMEPRKLLEAAGIRTTLASPGHGKIRGWKHGNWGEAVTVDKDIEEVSADDFDALLLPGGPMNPDVLRMDDRVIELIENFDADSKPIAAICHAPWLLIEADLVQDRTVTGWPSLHTDLENAGGNVVDQEVAIDGNIITSRKPDDIPAFTQALIDALEAAGEDEDEYEDEDEEHDAEEGEAEEL